MRGMHTRCLRQHVGMLGGCSWRFGDLGPELTHRGERMARVGAPPPCYLFDEADGFLAGPDRARMAAVDGTDRPLDLGHLLERGGNRVGRTDEQPRTFHLAGHSPPKRPRIRYWPYPVASRSCCTTSSALWQRATNASSTGAGSKPIDRITSGIRSSACRATLNCTRTPAPDGSEVVRPRGAAQSPVRFLTDGPVSCRWT